MWRWTIATVSVLAMAGAGAAATAGAAAAATARPGVHPGRAHAVSAAAQRASLVDSPTANLVLTAAHCVYGSGYATNRAAPGHQHRLRAPDRSDRLQQREDEPIKCASRSFEFEPGQMEFYCNDFQDGTSGGPWITGFSPHSGSGTVFGVIGGYEEGGDYPWASYSVYFSLPTLNLYWQAEQQQF